MTTPRPKRAFGTRDIEQFARRLAELRLEAEAPTEPGTYVAHTDGACFGNPEGPGGWAAVVDVAQDQAREKRLRQPALLWGHLSSTSNNRAEALGVLAALEWVPAGSALMVWSDSELTVRILQGRYKAKANPDIWAAIRQTIGDKQVSVQIDWVRGHAGDPLNELADRLSKMGAANRGSDWDVMLEDLDLSAPANSAAKTSASVSDAETAAELAGLEPRGEWEREFLRSVAKQLRSKRSLSPKQLAVIEKIRARGATTTVQD